MSCNVYVSQLKLVAAITASASGSQDITIASTDDTNVPYAMIMTPEMTRP